MFIHFLFTTSLYLFPVVVVLPHFLFLCAFDVDESPLRWRKMQRSKSESAICAPRLPGWRLPREGPEDGGGSMKVMDRTWQGWEVGMT